MERTLETLKISIPQGRTLRVRDAQGLTLRAVEGTLWVTEERDTEDYVLATGECRRIGNRGLTLVYAFDAARVELEASVGAAKPVFEIGGGYNEYAAAVWTTQVGMALRQAWRAVGRIARPARPANARP